MTPPPPPYSEQDIAHDPSWERLPSDTRERLLAGKALLLDCREPEERTVAAIEPSLFVPMGEVVARIGEIEDALDGAADAATDGEEPELIVYCHHGRRSFQVTVALREHGIANTRSMAGGIDAWSVCVDNEIPRY